eukprot:3326396-Pleurochrysis_carterae.AAC.2
MYCTGSGWTGKIGLWIACATCSSSVCPSLCLSFHAAACLKMKRLGSAAAYIHVSLLFALKRLQCVAPIRRVYSDV